MKVKELLYRLQGMSEVDLEKEVVIACERPHAISGQNCTSVDFVNFGFDWYHNKLIIASKELLYVKERG